MCDYLTVDNQILEMTTIINCSSAKFGYSSQGSGFFYSEIASEPTGPINEEKKLGWYEVKETWLITNRHVVFPTIAGANKGEQIETVPDSFTFNFKEVVKNEIRWIPVTLDQKELINRTYLHNDNDIDVAAIRVDDLLKALLFDSTHTNILSGCKVTNRDLPQESPLKMEAASDIIVCSYPRGFYDDHNKFPIIKSGIIASSWGKLFKGKRFFLIDSKLFPGSSGGLVLSKPTDIAKINGKVAYAKYKHYVFLGVYSGEYNYTTTNPDGSLKIEPFGLGIVWYSDIIPEIIKNGKLRGTIDSRVI